jgi:hypothetical protein
LIRPSPQQIDAIAQIARHNKVFVEWLRDWRQRELEQLPNIAADKIHLTQGRCQVLTELYKLVHDAPELAAKSRER